MKQYRIIRTNSPCWDQIERVELRHAPWLAPNAVQAWAPACHDGEKLYIRMTARETEIRATLDGPLDQICNDSCLEFFFAPLSGDRRYLNFEWNPLGSLYLGFGAERHTRVRQIVKDTALFAAEPFRTDDGWGITYAIPADFIRLYFPGFRLEGEAAGNFYKCGDETPVPHYLAWSELTSDTPDYHRRWDFGKLIFA